MDNIFINHIWFLLLYHFIYLCSGVWFIQNQTGTRFSEANKNALTNILCLMTLINKHSDRSVYLIYMDFTPDVFRTRYSINQSRYIAHPSDLPTFLRNRVGKGSIEGPAFRRGGISIYTGQKSCGGTITHCMYI